MTLIAYATSPNHAELLTDTLSYTSGLEEMGHSTKFSYLAHLDSLLALQGDSNFSSLVCAAARHSSEDGADFDAFCGELPSLLAGIWDLAAVEDTAPSTVHFIGYSADARRFVSHRFHSEAGFVTEVADSSETYVHPMPWSNAPDPAQHARYRERIKSAEYETEKVEEVFRSWAEQPKVRRPVGSEDWRSLGKHVREVRSLQTVFGKVPVGGDLIHSKISRGAFQSTRIYRFNDQGDEFLKLVEGSYHPLAIAADQVSPSET